MFWLKFIVDTMNQNNILRRITKPWAANADLFLLVIYGLLSIVFYLERTTFLDNPFTIFKLINDEALFVNANRYPAAVVQIIPLLLIKLGAPLKVIMLGCSISYFLFHAIIFSVLRFYLKDKVLSWLLLGLLIIPVAHTFYWNNNELFLGLSGSCCTSVVPPLIALISYIYISHFMETKPYD